MQKTGLKTFVYSFSVSLFAIFAANSVYLRSAPSHQDIKIPSKNVMLFLKNGAANPSLKPVPVKKIALNVLPELKKETSPPEAVSAEIVYEPENEEIIMANSFIPLETSVASFEIEQEEPAETVIVAAAEPLRAPPTPKKIKLPLEESPPVAKRPVSHDLVMAQAEKPAPVAQPQATPPLLKAAAPLIVADSNKMPEPLFPLEKSRDDLTNGQKIKIGEPNKLNQVALADKSIPIRSMENDKTTASQPPSWEKMSDKKSESDSPWVIAKGAGATRNGLLAEEEYYKKEGEQIKAALNVAPQENSNGQVQLASDTVKNLLIPIPEDILNDENLVPQLSYSSGNKETAKEAKVVEATPAPKENAKTEEALAAKTISAEEPVKDNLLSSLNTLFNSPTKVKELKSEPVLNNNDAEHKDGLFAEIQKKFSANKKVTIMPTEMRLSFQPNRAEISGQTLRWIQAFAVRAADDNAMSIEIRIDGTSGMDLQQKRLNLLHNILTNKGVEYSKINTVFTSREPNSFIIRTVTLNNDRRGMTRNNNTQTAGHYLQW